MMHCEFPTRDEMGGEDGERIRMLEEARTREKGWSYIERKICLIENQTG